MLSLALAAALAASPQSWTFKTGPKPSLEVSNISGSIEVVGGASEEVSVKAVVSARTGGPVPRVEAFQEGERVVVRTCCGRCEERGDRDDDCWDGARIRLTLEVPKASRLEVSAVSASVDVRGVSAVKEISSVSGAIDVRGSAGELHVNNVSGAVALSPAVVKQTQVNTVSGSVRIRLPEKAGAKVKLSTVSGRLNGQKITLGSDTQRFGDGAAPIDVSTVSGSVDVDAPRG